MKPNVVVEPIESHRERQRRVRTREREIAAGDADAFMEVSRRLTAGEVALRSDRKKGSLAGSSAKSRSRFRVLTKIFGSLAAISVAFLYIGYKSLPEGFWLMIGAGVGSLLTLPIAIHLLRQDAEANREWARRSPASGLRAFSRAMCNGDFEYAYQCLLPGNISSVPRTRPAISLVGLGSQRCSFDSLSGFAEYWEPVFKQQDISGNRVVVSDFGLNRQAEDVAQVTCRVKLVVAGHDHASDSIDNRETQRDSLSLTKLLRRVDGQWYVVNGELAGPEDTPEAFEEAVRISKLSDAELAAEAEAAGLQS